MKGDPSPPRLLVSDQFTLPELVDHMRQGQTVLGTSVKPYPWLDFATRPKSDTELKMETLLTGCTFKTITSCVLGYLLGGAFGLFTAGLDPAISDNVSKQTARDAVREMTQRGGSYARNFAVVGAMFSGTECLLESYRGKGGMSNSIMSGCITGGVLGLRAGVQAGAVGCGAFAAFSAVIDYFLRR